MNREQLIDSLKTALRGSMIAQHGLLYKITEEDEKKISQDVEYILGSIRHDGLSIVPNEPSEEMQIKGGAEHDEGGCIGLDSFEKRCNASDIYHAMVKEGAL